MTAREQLEILMTNTCQCGAWKEKRMALCRGCWAFLSKDVRKALYRRIPVFGTAYEAALKDLREVVTLPNGAKRRTLGVRVNRGGGAL